jgi:hypothetical protein
MSENNQSYEAETHRVRRSFKQKFGSQWLRNAIAHPYSGNVKLCLNQPDVSFLICMLFFGF